MYFIIPLMDMLSKYLWMIAFYNCYYMQLFFSRIPVFSSATWPTKILDTLQYFRWLRADKNTTIIFVGLASQRKYLTYFRRPLEPTKIFPLFSSATQACWPYFRQHISDENVNIFSSAMLADENSFIFIGNRRKSAYFHLFYSVSLISSADRRK
jgi:hypothetical protein